MFIRRPNWKIRLVSVWRSAKYTLLRANHPFRHMTFNLLPTSRAQRYIGKVLDGFLDERSNQVYVSTKENVLASLNADTGAITWRQILEKGDRGTIRLFHLISDSADSPNDQSVERANRRPEDSILVTVTGTSSLYLVRGWNARSGNLAWEWSITPTNQNGDENVVWFYEKSTIYYGVPTWGSQLEITSYNVKNGQATQKGSRKISISSVTKENCKIVSSFLVCSSGSEIVSFDVRSGSKQTVAKTAGRARVEVVRVSHSIFNGYEKRLGDLSFLYEPYRAKIHWY